MPLQEASNEKSLPCPEVEEQKACKSCPKPDYTLEETKSSPVEKTLEDSNKDVTQMPMRRISKEKAEEICLGWIKALNTMESKTDIGYEKDPSGKDVPEYCSNRI